VLLIILRHFKPIILRKHGLSNVCNLFIYLFILVSHFPCFTPTQQYRLNITIKYTDLNLNQFISVLPQWVQFYYDPICLLDRLAYGVTLF
jgi:hypothetical protein